MKIYPVLNSGKVQGIYSTFEKAKDSCRVWVAVNAVVNFKDDYDSIKKVLNDFEHTGVCDLCGIAIAYTELDTNSSLADWQRVDPENP